MLNNIKDFYECKVPEAHDYNSHFEGVVKQYPENVKICGICGEKSLLFDSIVEEYKDKDFICNSCKNYVITSTQLFKFIEIYKLTAQLKEFIGDK